MKIAIDGTAAAGKGTLSYKLSQALKLPRLDTGLLYRKVAFLYIRSKKLTATKNTIDETILNNLPYNQMLIDSSKSFNEQSWSRWVNKKIAKAIPGSLEFLNYAQTKNIELIYLSNRRIENYEPTKENLISLGFPFNEKTLMLLRDETTDKTKRRNSLSKYEIIMLIGDNLSDFDSVFYNKSNEKRINNVDSLSYLFGEKFILLPNLIYGDWDKGFE